MKTVRSPMYGRCVMTVMALAAWPYSEVGGPARALAQQSGSSAAVRAEVVKPVHRPVLRKVRLPASIRADELVDLYAKTSGFVGTIDVDIGSRVNKGDILVQIDVPEMLDELRQAESLVQAKEAKVRALQAKAAQAEQEVRMASADVQQYVAKFKLGEINLKRKQKLHKGDAIPEQMLDEAQSAHAVAEAQVEMARTKVAAARAQQQAVEADVQVAKADAGVVRADVARLQTLMEYAQIKAPFDGVITMRNVDHGAFVRSATEGVTVPLLQIAKISRMRIVMEIAEGDVPYVRPGTVVTVTIGALGDQPISATITRTAGALNPRTRTMRAEVDLDNSNNRLASGMYAIVVVNLESKEQAMMVPSKAIRARGKEMIVLVVNDGVAQARPISIGYDDGIWAEVLSGLDGNEAVITATSGAVTEGSPVVAVNVGS
ncbi:MAG: efflux RND transporter periplasmic adaptor subunit [Planctomycetes bacterium]|nr:efflux RND transporter periplasmic adaptor subunit [Planctomycetota bacterium]